jgi:hypothetical protein
MDEAVDSIIIYLGESSVCTSPDEGEFWSWSVDE